MKSTLLLLFFLVVVAASLATEKPKKGASYAAVDKPTKWATRVVLDADALHTQYLELPLVPRGCVVRVYTIATSPLGFADAPRNQTDWADYLRSLGMIFPNGGFAAYLPEGPCLIVANTAEQLRLFDPIGKLHQPAP